MMGGSVPRELLVLALVGLAGFALGWWLRRGRTGKEIEPLEAKGPTSIVPSIPWDASADAAPVAPEAAAALAAASQAMQQRQGLPSCPSCGSRMDLRVFKEKRIWVCEEFPVCRGAQMAE
jgi:hypothetical protein